MYGSRTWWNIFVIKTEHLVEELSVVVAVEEVRDVIVVFAMEKLLNIYFEKKSANPSQ